MAVIGLVGSGRLDVVAAQPEAKQSVRGGGVTVSVVLLKEAGESAMFRVSLDTHSVNLDAYRFEEVVRLRDGQGGELVPAVVEGLEGGGHHRSASIRFAWPVPKPKIVELVVKDVAGVSERMFSWTVK
jgi:hypothetical protein